MARRSPSRADVLCLGVTQLATISERRCERLVNPALSGLPAFLTRHGGLAIGADDGAGDRGGIDLRAEDARASGQHGQIPTSANREDHVSMSMAAGLKAARAVELARDVLACELLCACEAIDLLHAARLVCAAHARP